MINIKHYIDQDGDLVLETDAAGIAELRLDAEDVEPFFDSEHHMYYTFERFTANSAYEFIDPAEISALTNAPILGERDDSEEIVSIWWYPNYCLRSPQRDLMESGRVIFKKGQ